MYFLTEKDPNYTIKGSRDPLGFLKIWQDAGRKLIPHLSTVSNNIRDFQILCSAYFLKKEWQMTEEEFESFFIRYEQLMAYTRYRHDGDLGFNGVDKVRKIMSATPSRVRISNNQGEQLLSNQKTYGIWSKYNRIMNELNMIAAPELEDIYRPRIMNDEAFLRQLTILRKKSNKDVAEVTVGQLDAYKQQLSRPKGIEKKFFTEMLLRDTCGNELRRLLTAHPSILHAESFYDLLEAISSHTTHPQLKSLLSLIHHTEKVLCPLNRIFRYLQTQSFWTWQEIEEDTFIASWRTDPDTSGMDEISRGLANLLKASNIDLVKGLVMRNETVTADRGFVSWMRTMEDGVEVNHFQGAFVSPEFNPAQDSDNAYFLLTFIYIYRQLN